MWNYSKTTLMEKDTPVGWQFRVEKIDTKKETAEEKWKEQY